MRSRRTGASPCRHPLAWGLTALRFPLGVKDGIEHGIPSASTEPSMAKKGRRSCPGELGPQQLYRGQTIGPSHAAVEASKSLTSPLKNPTGGPIGVSAVGQRSCRMQLTSPEYASEPTSLATSRTSKTVPQPTTGICTSIQASRDSADKMGVQISLPVQKQPLALNDVITYPIRQSTSDWSHGSAFNTSSKTATMMKSIAKRGLSLQMASPRSGSTLVWG